MTYSMHLIIVFAGETVRVSLDSELLSHISVLVLLCLMKHFFLVGKDYGVCELKSTVVG